MITRPNISSIVASQVPDFVREDYPTFIAFLEAYYDFLETQTRVDLKSVRDLDTTLDSFIKHFKSEIGFNIPYTVVNERFLMKHIKDLYLAKGSEASYKLLFRLLFNKDIEMSYPGRQMLRASDGKWEQETSIFCEVEYGDVQQLLNLTVDVITVNKTIKVLVERVSPVTILVGGVETYSSDTYELLINRKYFGSLSIGDTITLGTTFIGKIVPTTSTVKVQQKGIGFKVGQLVPIQTDTGYGSIVKILSVDLNGGVKSAQFVRYGIGYNTNIIKTIVSKSSEANIAPPYSVSGDDITFNDSLLGFEERGFVNRNDYAVSAWDGSYAGETLAQFSSSITGVVDNPEEAAILKIELGGVAKYPGFYKNNDGFLDDDIYIQDSKYYQAFSYVIKIDERIEDFKSAVKTILHPTGMAMFAEYGIVNSFDMSVNLESMIKVLALTLRDEYVINDYISNFVISKLLEPETILVTEAKTLSFTKRITSTSSDYDGNVVDSVTSFTDSSSLLFDKSVEDSTSFEDDSTTLDFEKALSDSIPLTEVTTFGLDKALEDSFEPIDLASLQTTKYIEDTAYLETESGSIRINAYAESVNWDAEEYSNVRYPLFN